MPHLHDVVGQKHGHVAADDHDVGVLLLDGEGLQVQALVHDDHEGPHAAHDVRAHGHGPRQNVQVAGGAGKGGGRSGEAGGGWHVARGRVMLCVVHPVVHHAQDHHRKKAVVRHFPGKERTNW